jgi:hypothetical protein
MECDIHCILKWCTRWPATTIVFESLYSLHVLDPVNRLCLGDTCTFNEDRWVDSYIIQSFRDNQLFLAIHMLSLDERPGMEFNSTVFFGVAAVTTSMEVAPRHKMVNGYLHRVSHDPTSQQLCHISFHPSRVDWFGDALAQAPRFHFLCLAAWST